MPDWVDRIWQEQWKKKIEQRKSCPLYGDERGKSRFGASPLRRSGASASVSDTTIFTPEFIFPSYNNHSLPRPNHPKNTTGQLSPSLFLLDRRLSAHFFSSVAASLFLRSPPHNVVP
jgi:hypothetical protein